MTAVARYPDSTKTSLEQRLRARARERWPRTASPQERHRGNFSYVDATLTDATRDLARQPRRRRMGLSTGLAAESCQDAPGTACGLYLNDPTAWERPPTNLQAGPLSYCEPQPLRSGVGPATARPGIRRRSSPGRAGRYLAAKAARRCSAAASPRC